MNKRIVSFLFILLGALSAVAAPWEDAFEKNVQKQRKTPKKIAYLIGGSCDFGDNFIKEFNHWNAFLNKKAGK